MTLDQLQDGIYFRPGQRPPPCYRLLLLNFGVGTQNDHASHAIERILTVLNALRTGTVRDLAGQDEQEVAKATSAFEGFAWMLAFGRRLFDETVHAPALAGLPRPEFLEYLRASGDPFPALPWSIDGDHCCGEADVALQLTGPSEAAVNRAAVEVWKLVSDETLPLVAVASFSGFSRSDGRGWLDFHDGVSNIESSERLVAIQAGPDPLWMAGGTYMAFLRFAVNLAAWRVLSRPQQELIVGRDKLTGRPLIGVDRTPEGKAVPIPEPGPRGATRSDVQADFREPPQVSDPLLESSHLQRANRNRASPYAPAGQRIFRQGYEFLEGINQSGVRLGLNFVSFQADLAILRRVLHLPGWLGDVNFGGPTFPGPGDPPTLRLMSLLAGGLYAVPPQGLPFPGAQVFRAALSG
jgi:deferrochelatase/peroxidase EfeB